MTDVDLRQKGNAGLTKPEPTVLLHHHKNMHLAHIAPPANTETANLAVPGVSRHGKDQFLTS